MNIQLANVISDINGLSGQQIIAAILQGERDPWTLADLKHYRVRASREEVARSLEGNWREDVLFELQTHQRPGVSCFQLREQLRAARFNPTPP
jgi:transposase